MKEFKYYLNKICNNDDFKYYGTIKSFYNRILARYNYIKENEIELYGKFDDYLNINCIYCNNCVMCTDCVKCFDCAECNNCHLCTRCLYCEKCKYCRDSKYVYNRNDIWIDLIIISVGLIFILLIVIF